MGILGIVEQDYRGWRKLALPFAVVGLDVLIAETVVTMEEVHASIGKMPTRRAERRIVICFGVPLDLHTAWQRVRNW